MNLILLVISAICLVSLDAVYTTQWYGGNGGGYHTMFSSSNAYVTKVCLRTGSLVDQITLYFSDGTTSGPYGGGGGGYGCFPPSGSLTARLYYCFKC